MFLELDIGRGLPIAIPTLLLRIRDLCGGCGSSELCGGRTVTAYLVAMIGTGVHEGMVASLAVDETYGQNTCCIITLFLASENNVTTVR